MQLGLHSLRITSLVNVLFSAYNPYIDCKTADYKAFNTWWDFKI